MATSSRLVSLSGLAEIRLEPERPLLIVGRCPDCDVQFDSGRVSRRHCCLAMVGATVLVRDLGSSNGVWVNGHRVSEATLRHGDELALAHYRYRLELPPPARTDSASDSQILAIAADLDTRTFDPADA